jgi:hypothetical protein
LNLSPEKRLEFIKAEKEEMEKRILTGKTLKLSPEERERLKLEKQKQRYEFEKTRMGGYELIYPC